MSSAKWRPCCLCVKVTYYMVGYRDSSPSNGCWVAWLSEPSLRVFFHFGLPASAIFNCYNVHNNITHLKFQSVLVSAEIFQFGVEIFHQHVSLLHHIWKKRIQDIKPLSCGIYFRDTQKHICIFNNFWSPVIISYGIDLVTLKYPSFNTKTRRVS